MEKNNVVDKRAGSKGRYHLMKKVKVVILLLGLVLGLGLLASTSLADYTTTIYGVGGFTYRTVTKSEAEGNIRLDCRASGGGACTFCGDCHTSEPQSEILKKFTQVSWGKHVNEYFPRQTYSLSAGQRISWGDEGYYLNQRNRLVRYFKGKVLWTAPSGSRILKNKRGEPFALLFSGEPSR